MGIVGGAEAPPDREILPALDIDEGKVGKMPPDLALTKKSSYEDAKRIMFAKWAANETNYEEAKRTLIAKWTAGQSD